MRLLLVEDEERLANTIARGLRNEGMAVDVVFDGSSALSKAAVNNYDVVVLDRNLPGVHGDDVCRALVARQSTARILMLTAAGSIQDRVTGYLFPPGDAEALVERAVYHFDRPPHERRAMRRQCAAYARDRLTLDRHLDQLQQIYDQVPAL